MPEPSLFFEGAHDAASCQQGWHLRRTVEDEPVFFQRAGASAYVFGPYPGDERAKLVACAPNEEPWFCEACGTFVLTRMRPMQDARARKK